MRIVFDALTYHANNMKLKLKTQTTETLRRCFSQIHSFRKFVVLRFSRDELLVILADVSSVMEEPQVWCKFPMESIFSEIEISSLRENVILLEINIELFLQTLRNFDKANSSDLNIRLQRKEGASSRTAYLALHYTEVLNSSMSHTFRIPIKILKGNILMKVPELPRVDIMMKLPQEFSSIFRRLEKFRNTLNRDRVTIRATKRNGGSLQFLLEDADNYKVCLTWKSQLEFQDLAHQSDSLRSTHENHSENGLSSEDAVEITVRLRDWRLAQKIVGNCKTMVFLMCNNTACVIHCLLDDAEEVEMMYYIDGVRNVE